MTRVVLFFPLLEWRDFYKLQSPPTHSGEEPALREENRFSDPRRFPVIIFNRPRRATLLVYTIHVHWIFRGTTGHPLSAPRVKNSTRPFSSAEPEFLICLFFSSTLAPRSRSHIPKILKTLGDALTFSTAHTTPSIHRPTILPQKSVSFVYSPSPSTHQHPFRYFSVGFNCSRLSF